MVNQHQAEFINYNLFVMDVISDEVENSDENLVILSQPEKNTITVPCLTTTVKVSQRDEETGRWLGYKVFFDTKEGFLKVLIGIFELDTFYGFKIKSLNFE